MLKAFQDLTAVVDSAGICLFTTFAWSAGRHPAPDPGRLRRGLDPGEAAGGRASGSGTWSARFNLAAGFTAKDDTLPKRMLTEACQDRPPEGQGGRARRRCCRSTTSCAAGPPKGCPPRRPPPAWASEPQWRPGVRAPGRRLAESHEIPHHRRRPRRRHRRRDPGQGRPRRGHHPAQRRSRARPTPAWPSRTCWPGKIQEAGTHIRPDPAHYPGLGIRLDHGRARAVDAPAHTVALEDGRALGYDRLLVATGSTPALQKIPGIDLPGVHTCWTLEDARYLLRQARPGTAGGADGRRLRGLHHHAGPGVPGGRPDHPGAQRAHGLPHDEPRGQRHDPRAGARPRACGSGSTPCPRPSPGSRTACASTWAAARPCRPTCTSAWWA